MDPHLMAAHEQWYAALTSTEQRQLESLLRQATTSIQSAVEDARASALSATDQQHTSASRRGGSEMDRPNPVASNSFAPATLAPLGRDHGS
jgi:hypothetical protein